MIVVASVIGAIVVTPTVEMFVIDSTKYSSFCAFHMSLQLRCGFGFQSYYYCHYVCNRCDYQLLTIIQTRVHVQLSLYDLFYFRGYAE